MNTTTTVAPKLKVSRPRVSQAIGLGGLAFGDHYGPMDQNSAVRLIQDAVDRGVNYFDTSPAFGAGASELLLSLALGTRSEDVSIATKAIQSETDPFNYLSAETRESMVRSLEQSLRRLGRRYVDLYYLYGHKSKDQFIRTVEAAEEMRDAQLVRSVGIYTTTSYFVRIALRYGKIDAVMVPYNILNRPLDTDLLPYCREQGIAVHACEPFCRGLLTGQLHRNSVFGEGDLRLTDPRFRGDRFRINVGLVEQLGAYATRQGMTLLALSLGWILQHPAIASAVCGARSTRQIEQIIIASTARLTLDQILETDLIVDHHKYQSAGT
ncbi:MAG: aldo/keto reductase [Ignavibacteria bacterium]|nr:aldo/keto reductase [Ignavibacteria bacterium]